MKIIKPIVGISKIIDNYDAVVCGYNGVLWNGQSVHAEGLHALRKCAAQGKKVAVISNTPQRIVEVAETLTGNKLSECAFLETIATAGEILHYRLKHASLQSLLGKKYFNLGSQAAATAFSGLDYKCVTDIENADFVFIGAAKNNQDTIENYISVLEHAFALGLPLLCAGNDTSTFLNGEISLGAGALAEQYAVMGGKIITLGKPGLDFLQYVLESFAANCKKILFIGDSFATDVKSAQLIGAETILISKGIHVNFLGEGYIPDVEKTRHLAMNFELYPDYVISGLRW